MKQLNKEKIDTIMRKLGYNVKRLRLERGIDLPSVSNALNISLYVLKNIEDGKYPALQIVTIFMLARHFSVSLKTFFYDI